MTRLYLALFSVFISVEVFAEPIRYPSAMILYDQSGRESTLYPHCEASLSNESLKCNLLAQNLNYTSNDEHMAKLAGIDKELEDLQNQGEDIIKGAKDVCDDVFGVDLETELIEKYTSEPFRDIGKQYIKAIGMLCAADTHSKAFSAFRELSIINLENEKLSCSIGVFLSEMEFKLSNNKNYWVHESQGELGECSFVTTSTLAPYDKWKWEYKQTRAYMGESCEGLDSIQSYKTDSVKTFEVDCKAVAFTPLPY